MAKPPQITSAEWRLIAPHVPISRPDQLTLSAIVYADASNRSIEQVAPDYGLNSDTVRSRIAAWQRAGRWEKIREAARPVRERFCARWYAGSSAEPMAQLFRMWHWPT